MRLEHWWFTVPLRFRSILRRTQTDQELDEELRFHLENKIEEQVANGMSREDARYAAMRAIDGFEQKKEEMRDMRRVHWLTDFVDDLKYALRGLRRTPSFAALVVLTLGLGIGTNVAIFSMADALVLRPIPVQDPSHVVVLVSTGADHPVDGFSYREYLELRDKVKSYSGVVAYKDMEGMGFSAAPGSIPKVKGGMMVSANFFSVLGVEPTLGRGFRPDEGQVAGRDAVMVLGTGFWKQEFGQDPSVVGRHVRVNGVEFTVVGVAPRSFSGVDIFTHPDFYVPVAMAARMTVNTDHNLLEDRDDRELNVKARLKPGVTLDQARAELRVLAKSMEREYPKFNRNRGAAVYTGFEMRKLSDSTDASLGLTLGVLALAVLLVACTNVAGLLLTRAKTRTREIAVRLAIGAGRFRLVRLLFTESLIIALFGGLLGIVIGYAGVRFIGRYKIPTELPMTFNVRMDHRALLVSLLITLASAVLCGLAPSLQSTRADLVNGLKTADIDVPGRKRAWGRKVLVIAQVSTSLMLLMCAYLMVRGFQNAWSHGLGFSKTHLLMANFDPRLARYDASRTRSFYEQLLKRARNIPGVRSDALTENIPLGDSNWGSFTFVPEGFTMPRDQENFTSTRDIVDPGYFSTMGVPILRGRGFREIDAAQAPAVAVVNEQFAKHFWPGQDAVGKQLHLDTRGGKPILIVGVARTIKYQWLGEAPMDFVYLPLAQNAAPRMTLLLRSSGDSRDLVGPLRDTVRGLDPYQPIFDLQTYDDYYQNRAVQVPQLLIELVSAMGLTGLILALAGLYGLIAYNVNRRTREIGIRMAIGAGRGDVLRLVMRQGLVLVGIGMGFGAGRLLNFIFQSSTFDPTAYLVVVPAMFIVTMLAAYLPAYRASRIEPTRALRYE
jgi:predicted permease